MVRVALVTLPRESYSNVTPSPVAAVVAEHRRPIPFVAASS
jgi:hypothetical protein